MSVIQFVFLFFGRFGRYPPIIIYIHYDTHTKYKIYKQVTLVIKIITFEDCQMQKSHTKIQRLYNTHQRCVATVLVRSETTVTEKKENNCVTDER